MSCKLEEDEEERRPYMWIPGMGEGLASCQVHSCCSRLNLPFSFC